MDCQNKMILNHKLPIDFHPVTFNCLAFNCKKIKSNNIEGFYSLNCTNNKTGVAQFVYVIESKGTVDQL